MHDQFLKQVAESLIEKHREKIVDITLIFPNRRAGIFFTKYLNALTTSPIFAPEIITIQELFINLSTFTKSDPIDSIFLLYKVQQEVIKSSESFDDFYFWGNMLLHDFDQVDKYLVNADDLFTNITNLHEIDERFKTYPDDEKESLMSFWTAVQKNNKQGSDHFTQLWQELKTIFQKFKEELTILKKGYEGMIYREVAEKIAFTNPIYLQNRTFVLAGFNALNGCEKLLFTHLKNQKKASFYWDYDQFYTSDEKHEAGKFMRENLIDFPGEDIMSQNLLNNKNKKFKTVYIPSRIGQARVAAQEVRKIRDEGSNLDNCAIVLCDEELLLPVLSFIPEDINDINVTMGLSIKTTHLYTLLKLLVNLQKNRRAFDASSGFYYKDVLCLLENQLIFVTTPGNCEFLKRYITNRNTIYLTLEQIPDDNLLQKIFWIPNKCAELPDYFLDILKIIYNNRISESIKGEFDIYEKFLVEVSSSIYRLKNTIFNEFKTGLTENSEIISRETFFKIMFQYLNNITVPFEGEPLYGLQIMGLLETRTLDFQNIIMLSVNEGIMPKSSLSGSFIPYNLRKAFSLPTIDEQNAMFAYYFYRLIQKAENITFVYNSSSDGVLTGEKSRFLYQLELEMNLISSEQTLEINLESIKYPSISINKRSCTIPLLEDYLLGKKQFSPSSLNTFLKCPLSFYFKYIAGIKVEEEMTEEVDSRKFGNIFHKTMERLYKPFINRIVNESELNSLIASDKVLYTLNHVFKEEFYNSEIQSVDSQLFGRNLLVTEVINKMIIQTIRRDCSRAPFKLLHLEYKVNESIPINNGTVVIKIEGTIDRVDLRNGKIEIIDYKTGETDLTYGTIEELFDRNFRKRNNAAFQILMYALMISKDHNENTEILPGIYSLKSIFKEADYYIKSKQMGNQIVNFSSVKDEFRGLLILLLEEIVDKDSAFSQTPIEDNCLYCDFTNICRKNQN